MKINTIKAGGESGIRTHVTLSSKHAFQACAFSHSAISPATNLLPEDLLQVVLWEGIAACLTPATENAAINSSPILRSGPPRLQGQYVGIQDCYAGTGDVRAIKLELSS